MGTAIIVLIIAWHYGLRRPRGTPLEKFLVTGTNQESYKVRCHCLVVSEFKKDYTSIKGKQRCYLEDGSKDQEDPV